MVSKECMIISCTQYRLITSKLYTKCRVLTNKQYSYKIIDSLYVNVIMQNILPYHAYFDKLRGKW